MARHDFFEYDPDDLDVRVAHLLTSGEGTDPLDDPATQQALLELRLRIGQDVIFISHFSGGHRVIELVESEPGRVALLEGLDEPLESSWCYSVAQGRLPEFVLDAQQWMDRGVVPRPDMAIGTHISTPILLKDGSTWGMLCAFSDHVTPQATPNDLCRLRLAAEWLALRLAQRSRDAGQ